MDIVREIRFAEGLPKGTYEEIYEGTFRAVSEAIYDGV